MRKEEEKSKTKDYTLRAINKYNGKFDRIAVNLPKGSKAWIQEKTGKSCNAFFNDLFNKYKAKLQPDLIQEDGLQWPFE